MPIPPTCGSSIAVPGEVSLESYTASFGLGRQYQMDQLSNSLVNIKANLQGSTEAKTADTANAASGGTETKPSAIKSKLDQGRRRRRGTGRW